MRPRHQIARDRLEAVLSSEGAMTVPALAERLEISRPTALRMLHEVEANIVAAGRARRTRYAWRRPLRGRIRPLPVYVIDEHGRASEQVSALSLTAPQGSHLLLDAATWPVPIESADGWWDGLPLPLQDMRPQGFMGRHFARRHHRLLGVPPEPALWSDEDVLVALSHSAGFDAGGNLVIGNEALEAWQQARHQGPGPLHRNVGAHYLALAQEAVSTGPAGSSAAGEFPKFTTCRELTGAATPHVIVKFSGADDSAAVRRWSDLLVCECLALQTLAQAWPDVAVAPTRIIQHGGRTFVESERFDRHGDAGRSPLVSLGTVDMAYLGAGTNDWPQLASRLHGLGLLDAQQVSRIERIWWFGKLIGNTDMHAGNLSFVPQAGMLRVAPAYDMLPMMYAPLAGGEVPVRAFELTWPKPAERPVWLQACQAALMFWNEVLRDGRIGDAFKPLAQAHARALEHASAMI